MAMTVRFPPDLDDKLRQLADARHTSKHAIVLRAVEEFVDAEAVTAQVIASFERTLERDAELLRRLGDA